MKTLLEILSLKRPHGGDNEYRVAVEILTRLPYELSVYSSTATALKPSEPMVFVCKVKESRTLFTAHLDTVHKDELVANPVQYNEKTQTLYKIDGTPLGADDGSGIWLLYKMIEAGVPGMYMFTMGEECGGIGAKWAATNLKDLLSKYDRAIAFDRRGTTSIITHQGWAGRCCSDAFADDLSAKLGVEILSGTDLAHLGFAPDSGGVYTDTAEFTDIIPECTNVSVGYLNEHGGKETQDVEYLDALMFACTHIDWESLVTARDPTVIEPNEYAMQRSPKYGSLWGDEDYTTPWTGRGKYEELLFEDLVGMTDIAIEDIVFTNPEAVAELLISMKYQFEADEELIDDLPLFQRS